MYGHNNGVVCIAISHCGRYLASTCKARDTEAAAVLLWDTVRYTCIGSLPGHDSTVVCLAFSPNDRYLVSCGKDRAMCIHVSTDSKIRGNIDKENAQSIVKSPYKIAAVTAAAHKRIIWTSSWCNDGTLLATGARDGVVKVWDIQDSVSNNELQGRIHIHVYMHIFMCIFMCTFMYIYKYKLVKVWNIKQYMYTYMDTHIFIHIHIYLLVTSVCLYSFAPFDGVSVTAIAFGPKLRDEDSFIFAAGSEGGDLNYWVLGSQNSSMLSMTNSVYCHGGSVKRLAWTPQSISRGFPLNNNYQCNNKDLDNEKFSIWRIASCGEDNTVRVFKIRP
jgi:WD40 repeat protein